MVLKSDQQRIRDLLKEAIPMMCKNGLAYQSEFAIEALIGITLDRDDVFLVSIKETFHNDPPSQSSSSQVSWRAIDRHGEASGDDSLDSSTFKYESDRHKARRRDQKLKSPGRSGKSDHLMSDANIELEGAAQSPRVASSIHDTDSKQSKRPHHSSLAESSPSATSSHSKPRVKRRRSSEGTKSDDVVIVKDEPLSESEVSAIESSIRDSQLSLGDELPFHVSGFPEDSTSITDSHATSSRLDPSQTIPDHPSHSGATLDFPMQGVSDQNDQLGLQAWSQPNQPQPSTSQDRPPDFEPGSSADVPTSQVG